MFERFRDSLVYPSRILQFRKDSLFRVFGYMLLFVTLMSLGTIIFSLRFTELPNSFTSVFEESLTNESTDCVITDKVMTCTEEELVKVYDDEQIRVYVESRSDIVLSDYKGTVFNFIFHDDMIVLYTSGFEFEFTLEELPVEFHNIDFSLATSDSQEFSEQFLDAVSAYMLLNKGLWAPVMSVFEVLMNLFLITLIVVVNSWILKMRFKIIPYKELFKMSVYSSTSLYVLLTINGLINLGFIFLMLFVVVVIRQTNSLSMAIYKVIKKK